MELNNSNMKKLIKLIIITVLVVFCVFRFDKIYACGTWIIGLLMPFVIGFAIAFILNVPMKGFENLLFRNEKVDGIGSGDRSVWCFPLSASFW